MRWMVLRWRWWWYVARAVQHDEHVPVHCCAHFGVLLRVTWSMLHDNRGCLGAHLRWTLAHIRNWMPSAVDDGQHFSTSILATIQLIRLHRRPPHRIPVERQSFDDGPFDSQTWTNQWCRPIDALVSISFRFCRPTDCGVAPTSTCAFMMSGCVFVFEFHFFFFMSIFIQHVNRGMYGIEVYLCGHTARSQEIDFEEKVK